MDPYRDSLVAENEKLKVENRELRDSIKKKETEPKKVEKVKKMSGIRRWWGRQDFVNKILHAVVGILAICLIAIIVWGVNGVMRINRATPFCESKCKSSGSVAARVRVAYHGNDVFTCTCFPKEGAVTNFTVTVE